MEYHDKVLKCAECGAEFVFTAGEQMFFAERASRTSPSGARPAKRTARREMKRVREASSGSKPKPFARNAAKRPQFPSSPRRDARCIAANAFSSGGRWRSERDRVA